MGGGEQWEKNVEGGGDGKIPFTTYANRDDKYQPAHQLGQISATKILQK